MQQLIDKLGGMGMVGVISICLFLVVFGGMLVWAYCLKKPFLDNMSALPLDEAKPNEAAKGESNHD